MITPYLLLWRCRSLSGKVKEKSFNIETYQPTNHMLFINSSAFRTVTSHFSLTHITTADLRQIFLSHIIVTFSGNINRLAGRAVSEYLNSRRKFKSQDLHQRAEIREPLLKISCVMLAANTRSVQYSAVNASSLILLVTSVSALLYCFRVGLSFSLQWHLLSQVVAQFYSMTSGPLNINVFPLFII